MNKSLISVFILFLVINISGCVRIGKYRADRGLQQTISSLSVLDDFVIAASVRTGGDHRWGDKTCYMAQAIMACGGRVCHRSGHWALMLER